MSSTKRPWKVFTSTDGRKLVGIGSAEGEGICDAGFGIWAWNDAEGITNANLIVRSVNSHDDLLAALNETLAEAAEHRKNIIEARAAGFNGIDDPKFAATYEQEIARFDALIERARKAIAKAAPQ